MEIVWKVVSLLLKAARLTLFAFPILFIGAVTFPLTLFGWQGWYILCVMYFEGCSPSEAKRLIQEGVYKVSYNRDFTANYLQNRESDYFSNPMYSYMNTNTYSKHHRGKD
jgi:hypothetical protein